MTPLSPAHAHLREASAGDHARVDGCFEGGLRDTATYRRYLRGMHALLAALAGADAELDTAFAAHRRHLADDLAALGAHPPSPPALSPITDADRRLGARYVVEGSALGARLFLRQAQALGYHPGHGAAFLAYHVERSQHDWPRLKETLALQDARSPGFQRVIDTTRDIFALAAACFGAADEAEQEHHGPRHLDRT